MSGADSRGLTDAKSNISWAGKNAAQKTCPVVSLAGIALLAEILNLQRQSDASERAWRHLKGQN